MEAHEIRRVAVEASVDPKTVKKYLEGAVVRGLTRERISAALAKLGYRRRGRRQPAAA